MAKKETKITDVEIVETAQTQLVESKAVSNSAGQEIVVYGSNGEILDCKFPRVDFDNPSTILSYCGEIKDEISTILDSTAQLALSSEEVRIDETMLNSITSFDQSLDESEKKKEEEEKTPALLKGIKGILAYLGGKKPKDLTAEETTYKGRYERYCNGLEEVSAAVESQKQAALNDIQLRDEIIKEIKPWVEILEEMIKVGKIDRETYEATIRELESLPQDQDTQHMILYRTQLSNVFNEKLDKLDRALVALKSQIQAYRTQQNTGMVTVMEADSFLSDSAPLLKAQGSVMVFNRQEESRIADLAALTDASNTALSNNARDLEQNAQAAVELSINGGISVETLKEMDGAIQRGRDILAKGKEQKQQKVAQNAKAIAELHAHLDGYQEDLLNLVDDRSVMEDLLKGSSQGYNPTKKLGSRKTTKKGKK